MQEWGVGGITESQLCPVPAFFYVTRTLREAELTNNVKIDMMVTFREME